MGAQRQRSAADVSGRPGEGLRLFQKKVSQNREEQQRFFAQLPPESSEWAIGLHKEQAKRPKQG